MRNGLLWALLAAGAASPAALFAWTASLPAPPSAVGADPLGNVFVAVPRSSGDRVLDLKARSGRVRWRHRLRAGSGEAQVSVAALAPTGDGDVILAGSAFRPGQQDALVARLASAEGAERWRRIVGGSATSRLLDHAGAVVVDPAGDVLAGGSLQNGDAPGENGDLAVMKLGGVDGAERWRVVLPDTNTADAMGVDARGDVIAAGFVPGAPSYPGAVKPAAVVVVKLDGATGGVRWRNDLDVAWAVRSIAVDPAGDVLLAVRTSDTTGVDFGVAKVDGATGALRWLARESASDGLWEEAYRVVVDATGAVFAAGVTSDAPFAAGYLFTVVRLDGATGARVWSYRVGGPQGAIASTLGLPPGGAVVAAGYGSSRPTCADGLAVALDAETGARLASRTVDGTLTSRACEAQCGLTACSLVDHDEVSALVLDATGRPIVAGEWVNRGARGATGFLRRLSMAH